MTNVVKFPNPDDTILKCTNCGCTSFYVCATAKIECCNCRSIADHIGKVLDMAEWIKRTPEVPPNIENDLGSLRVIATNNADLSRRIVLKAIQDWSADNSLAGVVGFRTDGANKSWTYIIDEDTKAFVVGKFGEFFEQVKKIGVSTDE